MPPRPRPAAAGKAKRTAAATAPPHPIASSTQPVVVKSEEQSPPPRFGFVQPHPAAHAVSGRTDSEPIDIDLLEVSVIVLFECVISKAFQTSENAAADTAASHLNPPVKKFTAPSFLAPPPPAVADAVAGHMDPPVKRFTTPSFLAQASPAAAGTVAGHSDPTVKRFTTPSFLAQASPAAAAAPGSPEPTVRSFHATLQHCLC
jgi:hypothetical protein